MQPSTMKCPSMDPKNTFYHPNGGGRDTYITYDNGGEVCPKPNSQGLQQQPLFKNNYVKTLKGRHMVRPKQDAKVVAYWGDGSGRDTYCITDAGGLKGKQHFSQ